MIEEYARHNGHADILREQIDGVTGRLTEGCSDTDPRLSRSWTREPPGSARRTGRPRDVSVDQVPGFLKYLVCGPILDVAADQPGRRRHRRRPPGKSRRRSSPGIDHHVEHPPPRAGPLQRVQPCSSNLHPSALPPRCLPEPPVASKRIVGRGDRNLSNVAPACRGRQGRFSACLAAAIYGSGPQDIGVVLCVRPGPAPASGRSRRAGPVSTSSQCKHQESRSARGGPEPRPARGPKMD